jgi:immunity protein 27 of polymorphic toxin system
MSGSKVLRPESRETELVGRWIRKEGKLAPDDAARRITALLRDWFKPVAEARSGRETLLRDPSDGRLWEASYRKSRMHGGPPTLRVVSEEVARKKYGILI